MLSSKVGTKAVFDGANFPWVAGLEADWKSVRRELDALLEHRELLPTLHSIQPDQTNLSTDDRWRTFMLWGFGHRSDRNCDRCPETVRALERVPGLISAWFSILAPGKHVPRHRGITCGVIRCHLGLKVPARERGRCEMQVEDVTFRWEEGRIVLFNDRCKHEVWNDTGEERVVLIFDIERPMSWAGRAANRTLLRLLRLSPFVRDARRNQKAWEERVEGILPAGKV
jgi:aspartyl/asparaginyl beta-hydroxylase (cupin superfamily)